jgi:hypothetical protein
MSDYPVTKSSLKSEIYSVLLPILIERAHQSIRDLRDPETGELVYPNELAVQQRLDSAVGKSGSAAVTLRETIASDCSRVATLYSELAEPVVQILFDRLVSQVNVELFNYVQSLRTIFNLWVPVPMDGGASLKALVSGIVTPLSSKISISKLTS